MNESPQVAGDEDPVGGKEPAQDAAWMTRSLWSWPVVAVVVVALAGSLGGPLAALVVALAGAAGLSGFAASAVHSWRLALLSALFAATLAVALFAAFGWERHVLVAGPDMAGVRLKGAYLANADLHGVILRGADLRDSCLRGADLRGADLTDADFAGADVSGVLVSEADLQAARNWPKDGSSDACD